MIKKLFISSAILILILVGSFYGMKVWMKSLIPDKTYYETLKKTTKSDLDYLTSNTPEYRGKILAVVTNVGDMGEQLSAGFELTELARAYWVFTANGFEVDIASPEGGHPPSVLDADDMGGYDYAFLNDPASQAKLENSIALADIEPMDYEAVYFVGGKGTMFDFPENKEIQRIVKALYQESRVISAVCHGPAALLNVRLDDGQYLLTGKKVTGFTNQEELFLIPNANEVFPFLLEDMLVERGGNFVSGARYLEHVTQDGQLITGQNPWSVWKVAELVVEELGYDPKPRPRTEEEYAIELLMIYETEGYEAAHKSILESPHAYQNVTILSHALVSIMDFEASKGIELLRLANSLKDR